MLVQRISYLLCIGLVGVGVLVGGCNVFDISRADPDTVNALLDDARSALTAGNHARAVRLLEQAFDRDSTDIRVRIELANALLVDHGFDVFSLRTVAEHLGGSADSSGVSKKYFSQFGRNESVCTGGVEPRASPDRYEEIPVQADPIQDWVAQAALVDRVRRLVVTGALDRVSAFEDARLELRRKGLLVGAVAVVASDVIDVYDAFQSTESTLYLDRGAPSGNALLPCAETEAALEHTREALCEFSAAGHRAGEWLRERARLSGSDQESVLVGPLSAVVEATSVHLSCSGEGGDRPL